MTDTVDNSTASPSPEAPRATPEAPRATPPEIPRAEREERYEQVHQERVETRAAKVAAYEERQAVKEADFAEVRAAREEQYEQAHQQRVEARVAKLAAYNERHGQDAEAARASAERSVHAEETRFREAQQNRRMSGPAGTTAATARPTPPQGQWVSPPTPVNATFWNRTRQETDEAGRRWLVNLETGERVRLDGQLMDDGTVHYPNGDVEPARNWNRINPPASARPPSTSPSPAQNPPPATTPTSHGAGPWASPPAPGSPGVPGEVTGLISAQQYAQGMSAALSSHVPVIENFVAVLIASNVSGTAVSSAVRAQELTLQATQEWSTADDALSRQYTVRDAYTATPGAGSREFVRTE